MSLMETFSNPETIDTLTFGQKMQGSLITMLMGMGLTFLVLIIIWIFIAIMGKMMKTGKTEAAKATASAPVEAMPVASEVSETSDESLVAAITAAIVAYEGDQASNLVVTKITRLSGGQSPWSAAGLNETMEARKF